MKVFMDWLKKHRGWLVPVAAVGVAAALVYGLLIMPVSPLVNLPDAIEPSRDEALVSEVVAEGLDVPWELVFLPDGRLLISERAGRLVAVTQDGSTKEIARVRAAKAGEGGFLGMALSPDYPDQPFLYLYHTIRTDSGRLINQIVRYRFDGKQISRPENIIDNIPAASIHNGGRLSFGPDGKLYATSGDANRPELAQDLNSLAGKILRINPDGTVPADNPFSGSYVYSFGHRNPQGLAWHPASGDLYATEHGPRAHDEINLILAGGNYGWPEVRGEADTAEYIDPVRSSGNSTWAPSGAAFYGHSVLPEPWPGSLVFTGLRSQALWRYRPDSGSLQRFYSGDFGRLRTAVVGPDGALYVATSNRDGRGNPVANDDRLIKITIKEPQQ